MPSSARVKIGMSYETVVAALGQPTAVNKGSEMIGGIGPVTASTESIAHMFHTLFALWRRPEGEYRLIFEYDRLARIDHAPADAVELVEESLTSRTTAAILVVLVFAERPHDMYEACTHILSDAQVDLVRDGRIELLINHKVALDSTDEACWSFLITRALVYGAKTGQIARYNIDKALLKRFRTKEGATKWNAGVALIVPVK